MNFYIIVLGTILLAGPITAGFWDLSNTLNNLQNSIQNSVELPGFLTKPQNTLESVIGTIQATNFTCISQALNSTMQAIKKLKNEIESCGDNTPEDIKNVVKSTVDIARNVNHIQSIYNKECVEQTGAACATKMLGGIAKLIESVNVTNGLIAKVPSDPSICGTVAVASFGVTLTDLILSMKC